MSMIANEFRAVKKLCQSSQANIVQVFNMGQLKQDSASYFLDMELCSKVTLAHYISGIEVPTLGRWEPNPIKICGVLEHIVSGLAFIHGLGEVHRDLSPQNSILTLFASEVDPM
jgi:serine/threonine protein kinase